MISFHHIGLAVKEFSAAKAYYESLGYECAAPVIDPIQNVELMYCSSIDQPDVELVRPLDTDSPVTNILESNNASIYHTCYEVTDFENDLKQLFASGRAICTSPPKKAILFNNRKVSFYYLKDVGVIEVLQP